MADMSPRAVFAAIRRGDIPSVRIGRRRIRIPLREIPGLLGHQVGAAAGDAVIGGTATGAVARSGCRGAGP